MIVLIIDIPQSDFCIEIDDLNYTLFRDKVIETGKNKGVKRREVVGYYPNFQSALRRYAELESIEGNERITIDEYVRRVETAVQKVVGNKYEVVEVIRKKTKKKKTEER